MLITINYKIVFKVATLKSLLDSIAGVPGYSFLQTDYKTVEKPSDQMKIIQPMTHSKEVVNYYFEFKRSLHYLCINKFAPFLSKVKC